MGMQTMQAQQPMQGGGKGSMIQPMPMSGTPLTQDQMTAAQNNMQSQYLPQQPRPMDMGMDMGQGMGQQPRFGQPNRYSNTTQQPWDNANINQQPSGKGAGGKGGGMQQGNQMQGAGKGQAGGGYPTAPTNFGQPTQTGAYPTAQTNFGQGAPATTPLTAMVGQPNQNDNYNDNYSAAGAGGQGA